MRFCMARCMYVFVDMCMDMRIDTCAGMCMCTNKHSQHVCGCSFAFIISFVATIAAVRLSGLTSTPAKLRSHTYIGHNCIGHNYTGHNCIGHDYIGHNYTGHDYLSHDYTEPCSSVGVFFLAASMCVVIAFIKKRRLELRSRREGHDGGQRDDFLTEHFMDTNDDDDDDGGGGNGGFGSGSGGGGGGDHDNDGDREEW